MHRECDHDGTVFSSSDVDVWREDWKQLEEDTMAKREDSIYLFDKHRDVAVIDITEDMLKSFDAEYEKYKKEHVPEAKEITSKVDSLLNVMRADLGNEAYIRK